MKNCNECLFQWCYSIEDLLLIERNIFLALGPNVTISSDTLVMICRPGGKAKTRATLINDSDVPATFSFDVDEAQSSFKPAPTEGRVRARSHVDIVVTFEPALEGPQSMYIPCLLQHQVYNLSITDAPARLQRDYVHIA